MKGKTDKVILLALAMAGALAVFYFIILSPKREEASQLGDEVAELESSIAQQEQLADFAEQARQQFPRYYGRLVVLGKAVPDEADTASLLVQLSDVAEDSSVEFRGIVLAEGSAGAAASAPADPSAAGGSTPAPATTAPSDGTTAPSDGNTPPSDGTTPSGDGTTPASSGGAATTPAATSSTPAPATEASAASLPIGAVVGPAGLPTLPYDLKFRGSFFDVAGFMAGLDSLVDVRGGSGQVATNGRLLTVDGFSLSHPTVGPVPKLRVNLAVTSYVSPAEQGLTLGATPGAPAPSPAQPEATPASAEVAP